MSLATSVEQSLVAILAAAAPAGVKVTVLPVQQAVKSKSRGNRFNLTLLRAGVDGVARNAPAPPASRAGAPASLPLYLDYLVSVHVTDSSASTLLEAALRAFESQPILTTTITEPGATKNRTAPTVTIVDLSLLEWSQLWTAAQSPWQPALLLRIRAN